MKVSNEFASATELGGRGGIHGFGATSYVSSKEIDATPNIDQHVTGVDVNNNMTDITSTIGNVNSHTYASSHMNVNADDILSSMKEVNVDNFSQNDGAAGLYNNEVMADTSTSMQWNNGTTTRNCKEINYDPQPEVVYKKSNSTIPYKQQIGIRFLQPNSPPPPGPVVIKELRPITPNSKPPIHIRQRPVAAKSPAPVVLRENPPQTPRQIPMKIIQKRLPTPCPPPRKVIIERSAPLPPKPPAFIIERWLPYKEQKRRVLYQRAPVRQEKNVRNTIIQWHGGEPCVNREIHNLGVVKINPQMYLQKYAGQLRTKNFIYDTLQRHGINVNNAELQYPTNMSYQMSDDSRTSSKALDVSSTYGSTNYTSSLNFMNNYYENKPSGGNFNGATDFISNDKKIETTNDINDVIKQYSKSGYQTFEVKN